MVSVHSGSYLNIAGSSAAGCQGGLFPSESAMNSYHPTEAHKIRTPKAERLHVYVRKPIAQAHEAKGELGTPQPSHNKYRNDQLVLDLDVASDADMGIEMTSQLDPSDLRRLIITNDKDADLRFVLF
jgi:hypothetical protein